MSASPQLLLDLAAAAGMPPLTLDQHDCCAVAIADGPTLNFRWLPDDEVLVMFSVLGTLGLPGRMDRLMELMRANRFWQQTQGATLSLDDAATPRVLLARRFEARSVSSADFRDAVALFAEVAAEWQGRLEARAGAAGSDAIPMPTPGGMPSFA